MNKAGLAALDGWRALACAVLLQAHKDAQSKNGKKAAREAGLPRGVTLAAEARQFLASDGAAGLCLALEIDPAGLARALGDGSANRDSDT